MDEFSRKQRPAEGRRDGDRRSLSPGRTNDRRRGNSSRRRRSRSVERGRREHRFARGRHHPETSTSTSSPSPAGREDATAVDTHSPPVRRCSPRERNNRPRSRSGFRRRRRKSTERRHRSASEDSWTNRRRNRYEDMDEDSSGDGRRRRRKSRRRQRSRKGRKHRRRSDSESPSAGSRSHRRDQRAPDTARTGVVSDDDDHRGDHPINRGVPRAAIRDWTERAAIGDRTRVAPAAGYDSRSASNAGDDTAGHFTLGHGTIVADRYKIIREVGLGTFGRVVECLDLQRKSARFRRDRRNERAFVALKIVRCIKRYHDSALIEADIVETVNRRGGRGLTHCVILHDAFSFDGHFCLVFESLGPSIYDFLKRHNYQPFPMVCVQDFTVQLLEALEFLHGECRIVHTDLKIENILLVNDREVTYENQLVPESTRLKLIDFGGACYDCDKKSSVINTRQYRAPEVILGTGWSMPSDMWSVGCILAELYQGELLFATHDNVEHLALMERIIGPFPRRLVKAAKSVGSQIDLANEAFDTDGRHRMDRVLPAENASFVRKSPKLDFLVRNRDAWFLDLLKKMLVIDPSERATAHECLQFLSSIRRNEVRYCYR